jgi:Ser/Thr protein kinase RdoA (MazF antagonist)
MQLIGRELGRMHRADIIHGDLTTSNMIVRRGAPTTTTTSGDIDAAEIVGGDRSFVARLATKMGLCILA